ncbi:hypothetical protein F5Y17DRAFT_71510 [Xylariaceae sp. FL0594]|nr:hypothetical protein F5Y17DRAFT_71510 [Xylariaceae sp. FL0594]
MPIRCSVYAKLAPPFAPRPTRLADARFGEVEKRKEENCLGNGKTETTHHWTSTDNNIGSYIQDRKDIPKVTCKKEHTQACYHYRSVISRHQATKDMTEWTCQETTTSHKSGWGHDGTATDVWGQTAVLGRPPNKKNKWQHWFPWANGFVYREPVLDAQGSPELDRNGKPKFKGCNRDEFPPRYFWPGDKPKPPSNMNQWVRFIPEDQNRGAGQLWNGFANNNAASTTVKAGKTQTWILSSNVKSGNLRTSTEKGQGKDTTIHSTVSISTLRAIFSIADFDGLKPYPADGLDENPCYPKDLTDDPGWALLTNDPWYDDPGHEDFKKEATNYIKVPDLQRVRDAQPDPKRAVISYADVQAILEVLKAVKSEQSLIKNYVGDDDGRIPLAYWGVLPGLPALSPSPKRSLAMVAEASPNNTHNCQECRGRMGERGDSQDTLDGLSREELSELIERYLELVRRAEEDDVGNRLLSPHEVMVHPTPAGQGEPKATVALAMSRAMEHVPRETTISGL